MNGKHLLRFRSETLVFEFLLRSVNGQHLVRFQSETSVFKFPRRSVNGARDNFFQEIYFQLLARFFSS